MNDVADENGLVKPRIKLIRNESIGNYSWDTKSINNWTDSTIKKCYFVFKYQC